MQHPRGFPSSARYARRHTSLIQRLMYVPRTMKVVSLSTTVVGRFNSLTHLSMIGAVFSNNKQNIYVNPRGGLQFFVISFFRNMSLLCDKVMPSALKIQLSRVCMLRTRTVHSIDGLLGYALLFSISLLLSGCSGSDATTDIPSRVPSRGATAPVPALSDTGLIAPGDSIVVSVWDAPQFNAHAVVKFNGAITMPFVGEVAVAGYRKDDLVRTLRQRLSEYVKGEVLLSVEVFAQPPKISVFGMVARQGSFPANTALPLVEALIMAGGWSETADLRYIRIARQPSISIQGTSIEFDLTPFLETGDMRGMPTVYPGDVVVVPKKENYVQEFSGFVGSIVILFGVFNLFK